MPVCPYGIAQHIGIIARIGGIGPSGVLSFFSQEFGHLSRESRCAQKQNYGRTEHGNDARHVFPSIYCFVRGEKFSRSVGKTHCYRTSGFEDRTFLVVRSTIVH